MPGSRRAGRRGIYTEYDRVSTEFQGEAPGTGAMPGVIEGSVKGVTGGAPPNSARHDEREVGTGGRRGIQRRQSQDLQDDVYRKGWT